MLVGARLNDILKFLVLLAMLGQAGIAAAQQAPGNPRVGLDSKTLGVQAKAEELFERGDYRRAHVIYRNDLAPIGDKYAQYMLGFMTHNGLGVEQDPVLASAWYRLAAERGEPAEFVEIRDDVLWLLDTAEKARSDRIYYELRREYGDLAISMREVREGFEELSQVTTGSRIGGPSSAITIVEPRAGGGLLSSDALEHRIHARMQGHLDHITMTLGLERISADDLTPGELAQLEESVLRHVGAPDSP